LDVLGYAEWLNEAMAQLGIEKPHVVAHSFGCRVAIKLAKTHGQVWDKMVLTGAAGVRFPKGAWYKTKVTAYRACRKIAPNFAEKHFGSKEYRTLSPVMKESYKKIVAEDLRGDAKEVKNQVLLVQGREDRTTTLKEAQAYLATFPNATLTMIDGGHFAFVQHAVPFNLTVEEFLQNV
jgi:pimeloyl-ACP methyl ester carboxylesterase